MIYSEIIKSKDGFDIPVFSDKKLFHSKYNPIKEAENFGSEISNNAFFTIILGLGGGYHIESFCKKNPRHFILVIENSFEDIEFLSKIDCVKNLFTKKNILIISKSQIFESIINNYIPAFHGGINILTSRAWINFNGEKSTEIFETMNFSISEITKDFSVQSHFGFIWQKNILNNLKIFAEKIQYKKNESDSIQIPFAKNSANIGANIAAIIAAGPSLDFTINQIKQNRKNYFVIATDTAISALIKNDITFDAAISIDGQNISYKHFIGLQQILKEKNFSPFFIFDLQSNYNAVNYVANFSDKIIFTKNAHPFCNYVEKKLAENFTQNENFITLDSGAGTVTIAAIDFARKIGFTKFEVFGADFSYLYNKPYTKGTYLDSLYRADSAENKINSSENKFVNLLYRTEIKKNILKVENLKNENSKNTKFQIEQIQTEILNSYKKTFLDWIYKNGFEFNYENFIYKINSSTKTKNDFYKIQNQQNEKNQKITFSNPNNLNKFFTQFQLDLKSLKTKIENSKTQNDFQKTPFLKENLSDLEISLLPFIAFLRNKNQNLDFYECLKLALTKILEYNFTL